MRVKCCLFPVPLLIIWSFVTVSATYGQDKHVIEPYAGFSGAVIPIILTALGQDPAQSSSIILTTVTDICGFLSFLGLATALATVLGIV